MIEKVKTMNSKRNALKLNQFMQKIIAFFTFVSLFLSTVEAEETQVHFDKLQQINNHQANLVQWQQLLVNPSNQQQFFVINTTGQMFLVDDMKNASPLLNLNTNETEVQTPIKLTAFVLHPNFALREQEGYGTFYTAHLEALDKQSKTKRLQENNDELTLEYDSVITEWQFNSVNYQTVDLQSRREVLRIAVPTADMIIQQMSFSPYTKSWNDGFGLLYIALSGAESGAEKRQEPLYSGVILRINPAKFGLRSFTIPNNNPYLKNHDIRDEIYLLGAQKIKQFMWADKSSNNLLLSHQYKNKHLLSLGNTKEDWRKKEPSHIIYQSDTPIQDALIYHGRYLPHLRNKLLTLTQVNNNWLVDSLKVKLSVGSVIPVMNKVEHEWHLDPQQIASESNVSFGLDFSGEVLMLDKTLGKIFQLPQESSISKGALKINSIAAESQEPSSNSFIFALVFIFIMFVFLYFIKRNTTSAKAIVRTRYAQVELSESQHQIGFYHRHKNTPDTILDIIDIEACEVLLNDTPICTINRTKGHGFDDDKDQDLRTILDKEKADKMIDGKLRQVTMSFTNAKNKSFIVCLYMRKGSDRVTKKSYTIVIEDLIDWCWLIASKINPDETSKRKERPIISSKNILDDAKEGQEKMSLHGQAAMNRQALQAPVNITQQAAAEPRIEKPKTIVANASNNSFVRATPKNPIDTELVDALEKLVDLKQQGFLTEEEFTVAKENLLSSLFDK